MSSDKAGIDQERRIDGGHPPSREAADETPLPFDESERFAHSLLATWQAHDSRREAPRTANASEDDGLNWDDLEIGSHPHTKTAPSLISRGELREAHSAAAHAPAPRVEVSEPDDSIIIQWDGPAAEATAALPIAASIQLDEAFSPARRRRPLVVAVAFGMVAVISAFAVNELMHRSQEAGRESSKPSAPMAASEPPRVAVKASESIANNAALQVESLPPASPAPPAATAPTLTLNSAPSSAPAPRENVRAIPRKKWRHRAAPPPAAPIVTAPPTRPTGGIVRDNPF